MAKSNVKRHHSPEMTTPTLAPGKNGLDHDLSFMDGNDPESREEGSDELFKAGTRVVGSYE